MMDDDERKLVRASMHQLLTATGAQDVPEALLAGGWAELLEDTPEVAVSVLAEEQGRNLAVTPSLDLVMAYGAGLPLDATAAFVLPTLARPFEDPVAPATGAVDGLTLAGHGRATRFLAPSGGHLVEIDAADLRADPISGSDPALHLARVTGTTGGPDASSRSSGTSGDTEGALSAGRRFLAAELIGVSQQMLDDTVAYVTARHQFGRPIATFQAVKHRLTDVAVAIAAARAGLRTAWLDRTPLSAMAAKALAGRAHRLASTHCHQVHGGIAFTVEHGFYGFIRRGQILDGLLGGADALVLEIGRSLSAAGSLPRTPKLALQTLELW